MITQTTEYALRAIVHLAKLDAQHASAQDIADAVNVPAGYLQKVLRMLARDGLLTAQRGTGGGFSLGKPSVSISVLDVLRATDDNIARIERCPLGIDGHTTLCSLHALLDAQLARVEETFAATTIADLVSDTNRAQALCSRNGKITQLSQSASTSPDRQTW